VFNLCLNWLLLLDVKLNVNPLKSKKERENVGGEVRHFISWGGGGGEKEYQLGGSQFEVEFSSR
jgi:hypothetical protein